MKNTKEEEKSRKKENMKKIKKKKWIVDWAIWWDSMSVKISFKISQTRWCVPIVPATREAEARGSLELKRLGLQWTKIMPLNSSLSDSARPCLSPAKKEKKIVFDRGRGHAEVGMQFYKKSLYLLLHKKSLYLLLHKKSLYLLLHKKSLYLLLHFASNLFPHCRRAVVQSWLTAISPSGSKRFSCLSFPSSSDYWHRHAWLVFVFLVEMDFTTLARLVLKS